MLDLDGDVPVHLFDAYAMTNIRLCSAFAAGRTDSCGTAVMSRNCLRHLSATLRILEPTLCIVQGVDVAAGITPILRSEKRLSENLVRALFGGVDALVATFAHPSARPPLRWGGLSGVPYLDEMVTPAIRQARELLTTSPPEREREPAFPASPPGVRRRVSLPMRTRSISTPGPPPSGRRSTAQVAAEARAVVASEIERRGGAALEVRTGMRVELRMKSHDGESRAVRVVSRRSGDWQTSIEVGYSAPGTADRYWVFVDLGASPVRYYIAPEQWVAEDVREEHDAYLSRNGGRRVRTEDSKHHRVQTRRVARWADRWDLLGLE